MARQKRTTLSISLTEQERLRFDKLNNLENRRARAQLMLMVDARLAVLDPQFLADSKGVEAKAAQA